MDTKAAAKEIRAAFKAKGWSPKVVGVRTTYSSIDVTIKDTSIAIEAVNAIARPYAQIDRCPYSGDILSGGNTYVSVQYDWRAERATQ